jgi:CRP-like cAMP-binding protein
VLLETLFPGNNIGDVAFVLGTPHPHDVVATSLCECLLLPRRPFQELLRRFPKLAVSIQKNAEKVAPANRARDAAIIDSLLHEPKVLQTAGSRFTYGLGEVDL